MCLAAPWKRMIIPHGGPYHYVCVDLVKEKMVKKPKVGVAIDIKLFMGF